MTYMIKIICTFFFLNMLFGCGSGGEESSTSNSEPATVASAPAASTTTTDEQTTDDLVSNTEFEFSSGFDLTIVLAPIESAGTQYFVNVCSDYELLEQEYVINYESCKVRTMLTSDEQVFEVALSAAETTLLAQVWPIENDAIPLNYFWERSEDNAEWIINLED